MSLKAGDACDDDVIFRLQVRKIFFVRQRSEKRSTFLFGGEAATGLNDSEGAGMEDRCGAKDRNRLPFRDSFERRRIATSSYRNPTSPQGRLSMACVPMSRLMSAMAAFCRWFLQIRTRLSNSRCHAVRRNASPSPTFATA